MKFKLLTLICLTQLLTSCSKSGGGSGGSGGGTPTPTGGSKGYIRVTFGGKTLEVRDTFVNTNIGPIWYPLGCLLNSSPDGSYFLKGIGIASTLNTIAKPSFTMVINFSKDSSTNNSPLDTYDMGEIYNGAFTLVDLTNSTSYPIDTPSSATVTYSNANNYTEGTMKLTLRGSGMSKIPATGVFKIYHKL
jgi:hypothetical protein